MRNCGGAALGCAAVLQSGAGKRGKTCNFCGDMIKFLQILTIFEGRKPMRRHLMLLLCCALLCGAVSAANGVTGLQSHTNVNADGSCQVSMTVEIRAEAAPSGLSFPLPGSATGITLNGSSVRTHRFGGFRTVNLSKLYGGSSWQGSIALQYRLPAAVTRQEDGTLLLEIPILCGFAFRVEKM